jgi:hypothetical protein
MGQLITKTIAGLYNGVSRQAAALRLDNQCEEQINAIGFVEEGLVRRPPVEYFDAFPSSKAVTVNDQVFFINRSDTEKYLVILRQDASEPVWVYDVINKEFKTVQYGHLDEDLNFTADSSVKDYLTTGTELPPSKRFHVLTVADYTIITNRQVTTAMSTDKTSAKPAESFVYCESAITPSYYGRAIEIRIEPYSVTYYEQFDAGNPIAPHHIPGRFAITTNNVSGYTVIQTGPVAKVSRADGMPFTVTVTQGASNSQLRVFNSATVEKLSDLFPPEYFPGTKIKINLGTDNTFLGYYVKSDGSSWVETNGWDIQYKINASTMPHRLVRMSDGSFVFADITWGERLVGDDDTAPLPSFIGRKIFATFFFQNRFGILADDTVALSTVADYWNFFPSTVLEILDDDPIDLGVAVNDVVKLRAAVPFNENLLLLADKQQFVLRGNPSLTPTTAAITPTTAFSCDSYSLPAVAGTNTYFMSPTNNGMQVREYFVQPDTYTNDAANITIHVPNYLPLGSYKIFSCPEMDMLFFWTSSDPATVYVYKYLWLGNQKPQSEWCKWTFSHEIRGIGIDRDTLILLFHDANQPIVGKCRLRPTPHITLSNGQSYVCHLDNLLSIQGTFDGQNTTWTLPFNTDLTDYVIVDPDSGFSLENVTPIGTNQLQVVDQFDDKPYLIGRKYSSLYTFSKWFLKQEDGKILKGRLQFRTLELTFSDTGYFDLEVEAQNRDVIRHTSSEFTAVVVGASQLDEASLQTGKFKALIMANAETTTITLKTDTHFPFKIHAIHQEGYFHERSRLI